MKWGTNSNSFARPVQWLLALYGQEVVSLTLDGIVSSNTSRGHRFMAPESIKFMMRQVTIQLVAAHVIVDPAGRRVAVLAEIERRLPKIPV